MVKGIAGQGFGGLVAIESIGKPDSRRSSTPRKHKPEVGVTYGYLTYISEAPRIVRPSKSVIAGNFRCVCGKEVVKGTQAVLTGDTTSCGCMKGKGRTLDLTNKKFGRLTAVRRTDERGNGGYLWECVCDCGNTKTVSVGSLNSGTARSCGCLRVDRNRTHGMTGTPTYSSYRSMLDRTKGDRHDEWYEDVSICPDWDPEQGGSFENFLSDMGVHPEGTTLNRINGAKVYSKETCEWATLSVQSFDQRRSKVNTSGRTGVFKIKGTGRWMAQITKDGEAIRLYYGDSFEEACESREKSEIELYGFVRE